MFRMRRRREVGKTRSFATAGNLIAGVCLLLVLGSCAAHAKSLAEERCDDSDLTQAERLSGCTEHIREIQRQKSSSSKNSDLASAYWDRGFVYYMGGRYDAAIADYSEAIRLDPRRVTYLIYRGESWLKSGNVDRAI